MSEVKDRHRCGECDHYDELRQICHYHQDFDLIPYEWAFVEPDDEACSDFEPKGGWQE